MNKLKAPINPFKIGLMIGFLTALTGCAGFGGGVYYGGAVEVQEPDQYLFGGAYDNGRDVQNYSHRGAVSRGTAHPGGSHGAVQSGGGHGTAHPGGGGGKR